MREQVKKASDQERSGFPKSKRNAEPIDFSIRQDNSLRIDHLISAYYGQKSIEQDQSSLVFSEDAFIGADEIARQLMGTPSVTARHLLLKLNIFENELADEIESGSDIGSNALVLFAGIKRDVMDLLAARVSE